MRSHQFAVSKSLLHTFENLIIKLITINIKVTKLDPKIVKQTLAKLDLETILRLLLLCQKDYQLFSGNDVNSPRKELSIHRQALIDYIVDHNNKDNEEIYEKAEAIAESLAEHDEEIQTTKEEIKPLQDKLKVKKDRLKTLAQNKESFRKCKDDELEATLDDVALNKLAQYNAAVEKAAAKEKNKKQIKKSLKEVGKGLIASDIAGVTEEFGEAIFETSNVTLSFVAKMRTRIREHKETGLNLNTVAGINAINQKFDQEWQTEGTNIINKTKSNPDWKQTEAVTCQFEEVSEPKLLMPAKGEAIAIAA